MTDDEDDEIEVLKAALGDVKPLPGKSLESGHQVKPPPVKVKSPVRKKPQPGTLPQTSIERTHPGAHEIDARTAERLRKGQIRIDGKLDLHGMNQAVAHTALNQFLSEAYSQNKRCILVVTGKGVKRTGEDSWMDRGTGVLRDKLPEWLSLSPLCDVILKCQPARPQHGGEGAFYILLRRKRDY
jgi:DNA-nicking Smr family endonuclease